MSMSERDEGRGILLFILTTTVVLIAAALTLGSPASGQTQQGPPPPASTQEESRLDDNQTDAGATTKNASMDAGNVEEFMDGFVPRQLEEEKIPGATVSVVKDGEVLFTRGYGLADVENDRRVVADETLFRIASMSKPFTATAVMQLVEEGKLDLDTDVNEYLGDVEIPDTYPGQPVTLRHLLTHTAGFEESFTGSLAQDSGDVVPLGKYLSENTPERVRPPGEVTAYSNYGMSLSGHIVEEVSGMSYDRYLKENVFDPLGMDSTTAAQPPSPELRERLAAGYEVGGDGPVAGPFEYIDDAPAGAVSTTSTDMARFMISHLNEGSYDGNRILEENTAREMHAEQFVNAPGLQDGMGLGFYEQTINGERAVQHAGNLIRFHGLMTLLPEREVGVFVTYNSYGDGGNFAEYEMTRAFMDRFYPEEHRPTTLEPPASESAATTENFTGSYRSNRSNSSGFEKFSTLLTGVRVIANPDGSLTTNGMALTRDLSKSEQRWVRVAPATFQAVDGDERIAFKGAGSGQTYLASDADPTSSYAKLPFYESPRLHLGLLLGGMAVLILSTLAWMIGAVVSWWRGRRERRLDGESSGKQKSGRSARRARLLASAVAALVPLFAVGMMTVLSNADEMLGFGATPFMIGVLTLPILISIASLGVLVYAALAWKRGYWGIFGRLQYSLVALSTATFVAVCFYYNLIGYQF